MSKKKQNDILRGKLWAQTLKFFPVNVWPNCQLDGTMFHEVEERRSLPVTLKESDWPTRTEFDCQFWPQLRLKLIQPVFDPLTLTFTISPAPATLVIKTKLK